MMFAKLYTIVALVAFAALSSTTSVVAEPALFGRKRQKKLVDPTNPCASDVETLCAVQYAEENERVRLAGVRECVVAAWDSDRLSEKCATVLEAERGSELFQFLRKGADKLGKKAEEQVNKKIDEVKGQIQDFKDDPKEAIKNHIVKKIKDRVTGILHPVLHPIKTIKHLTTDPVDAIGDYLEQRHGRKGKLVRMGLTKLWKALNKGRQACNDDQAKFCPTGDKAAVRTCFAAVVERDAVSKDCRKFIDGQARRAAEHSEREERQH